MAPPPARRQVRPYRRAQRARASRGRQSSGAALASARARVAQRRAQGRIGQRGTRGRPAQQRAVVPGGGDESNSEDSRILEPAGDGGSDAGHPGSDDEMAGGVAAILGQPEDM